MKHQIFVINGGDVFDSYEAYLEFLTDLPIDFERYRTIKKDWKSTLGEALGDGFEVIMTSMPNRNNAKYNEWKIWFEKFVPHMNDGVILLGHSLGGAFLAKYLSENDFPKKIGAAFLVAPSFANNATFSHQNNLAKFGQQAGKIFIYQSKDDMVVPPEDADKYGAALPEAKVRFFEDRGHFNQEEFPEIIADIKALTPAK